jgi:hypothetical protein
MHEGRQLRQHNRVRLGTRQIVPTVGSADPVMQNPATGATEKAPRGARLVADAQG